MIGWGWFYLSTILDDFSRYIIAWKLCTTMRADDVTDTLQLALTASGCDQVRVAHKPRCSATTAPATSRATWRNGSKTPACAMRAERPVIRRPRARSSAGTTLKNRILLDNYYLPGDLEAHIGRFVDHYNHRRYHESLQNLTPADVYFGRGQTILLQRERIKQDTIKRRRLQHQSKAA